MGQPTTGNAVTKAVGGVFVTVLPGTGAEPAKIEIGVRIVVGAEGFVVVEVAVVA